MTFNSDNPIHIEMGEAIDQETIIRIKPMIIEHVSEYIEFDRTELFWNMDTDTGNFLFEIHFFANA